MTFRRYCFHPALLLATLMVADPRGAFADPPAGGRVTTQRLEGIERNGVTFYFSSNPDQRVPAACEVGRYVSGDWFVVAQPNRWIVRIDPQSEQVAAPGNKKVWIHGAEINPAGRSNGFDQRIQSGAYRYDHATNIDPGASGSAIKLDRPMTIIKAISRTFEQGEGQSGFAWTDRYEALTVVNEVPPTGAFRPTVLGEDKTSRYTEDMIEYDRLRNLPRVGGMLTLAQAAKIADPLMPAWFQAASAGGDQARRLHATQHHVGYGRDMARNLADAMIATHQQATPEQKRDTVVNLVQIGLDLCAQIQSGRGLGVGGAITQGRKPVAVYAAVLLNDPKLLETVHIDTAPASWGNADLQFYHITENHIGRVIGAPSSPNRIAHTAYEPEHLGFPAWRENESRINASLASNYRFLASEPTYRSAIAMHLTEGAVEAWGSPVLFEYTDRVHRWFGGHSEGKWRMEGRHWRGVNLPPGWLVPFYEQHRGSSTLPIWEGNPEQMWPPRVSAAEDAASVTVNLDAFQCLNGGEFVRRDLRYQMVGGDRWEVFEGVENTHTVEGLSGATAYDFQTRVVSTIGAGAWSTNLPQTAEQSWQARVRTATHATAPLNWVQPTLAAPDVRVGLPMSVRSTGQWAGHPEASFTYQWQRHTGEWHNIPGATNDAYTPVAADTGLALRCTVLATNTSGSAWVDTEPTRRVDAVNAPPTVTVAFKDTHVTPVGDTRRIRSFTWPNAPAAFPETGHYVLIFAGASNTRGNGQYATPLTVGAGSGKTLAEQRFSPGAVPITLLTRVVTVPDASPLRMNDPQAPFARQMMSTALLRVTGVDVDRAVGTTSGRLANVPAGSLVIATLAVPQAKQQVEPTWTGAVKPLTDVPFGQPVDAEPGYVQHGRLFIATGYTDAAGDVEVSVDAGESAGMRITHIVAIPPYARP